MASSAPPRAHRAALDRRALIGLTLGLVATAILGGLDVALMVAVVLVLACTRRWWGQMAATALLLGAGVVGFVGFFLASMSRQEISDC
jgi:hypothetical protein